MSPAEYDTARWHGWVSAVRAVVATEGGCAADVLHTLIEQLKAGEWSEDDVRRLPPAVSTHRRLVLDELARACAAAHGWDEWPYPGDLLPTAPDDLAGQ